MRGGQVACYSISNLVEFVDSAVILQNKILIMRYTGGSVFILSFILFCCYQMILSLAAEVNNRGGVFHATCLRYFLWYN